MSKTLGACVRNFASNSKTNWSLRRTHAAMHASIYVGCGEQITRASFVVPGRVGLPVELPALAPSNNIHPRSMLARSCCCCFVDQLAGIGKKKRGEPGCAYCLGMARGPQKLATYVAAYSSRAQLNRQLLPLDRRSRCRLVCLWHMTRTESVCE